METKKQQLTDGLDHTISLSLFVVTAFSIILILVYRYVFPGTFSIDLGHWGAFGSFIGGLLTPAISFVALLALVKTIALQRGLLIQQAQEFENLLNLQRKSLEEQQHQIAITRDNIREERIISYKSAMVRMQENLLSYYQNKHDLCQHVLEKQVDLQAAGGLPNLDLMRLTTEKRDALARRIQLVHTNLVAFAIEDHPSIDRVKAAIREVMEQYLNSDDLSRFDEVDEVDEVSESNAEQPTSETT